MRNLLILKELLNASDYLTLNFFVDKLGVSKRTIQNEIASLVRLGVTHGFNINSVYGKGYLLEVQNRELFRMFFNELSSENRFDKQAKRYDLLAILLLNGDKYISVANLSEQLLVSKTFINNQLQDIENHVEEYRLNLERKSHYGIRLIGKAQGFIDILLQLYLSENPIILEKMDGSVSDFMIYEEKLLQFLKSHQMRIDYLELQSIINRLKVIILFYKKCCLNINKEDYYTEEKYEDFYHYLLEIEDYYNIYIEEDQKESILTLVYKDYQFTNDYSYIFSSLQENLIDFLREVDKEENTRFSEDNDFIERLYLHLKSLVERLNRKVLYENPMLVELSIKYPRTFNLVFQFSDFFKDTYGLELSNDELSFIATHFLTHVEKEKINKLYQYNKIGIVCATGGGVAYLIKMQIESLFPISEIETFSMIENEELEAFNPDLIFTITPLLKKFKVPTILIKELLSDDDLIRIKEILLLEEFGDGYTKHIEANQVMSNLFYRDLFHNSLSVTTYSEALETMAENLFTGGYAAENFKKNIFLREEYMSTVFNNGVAIPHPIELNAKKSAISLAIVDPVITETEKEVRLIFMICLRKEDYQIYNRISETLFHLMNDEQKVNDIENMQFFEEIINTLVDIGG